MYLSFLSCKIKIASHIFYFPIYLKHKIPLSILLKRNNRPKNGVTFAKTHQDSMPNLIVFSASPKSRILNQSVWNFLVNAGEVVCLKRPFAFP